ncbi:MFS transporter [Streptomyces sp. NPDC021224]|uniref:MFS transporter n=1 Tax=unclassified Streptomyces TaxID=2593676 RepID=UPI00379ED5F4
MPTPLHRGYAARFGFSPLVVTLIFAAYVAALIPALLPAGPAADAVGHRRVPLPARGAAALGSLLFALASGTGWLFAAGVLQGAASGPLTAAPTDLEPAGDRRRAALVSTVASVGGLGLGPVVGGLLAQYAPAPRVLPFAVEIALLVPAAAQLAGYARPARRSAVTGLVLLAAGLVLLALTRTVPPRSAPTPPSSASPSRSPRCACSSSSPWPATTAPTSAFRPEGGADGVTQRACASSAIRQAGLRGHARGGARAARSRRARPYAPRMPWPLSRPALGPYRDRLQPPAAARGGGLRVTWLEVSTLLLDDGRTALMTDGFFSRPGLLRCLTRIAPDERVVRDCLARLGVTRLAAVVCAHTHYDHALDAPLVCRLTGARLVGSASTANVGRGGGLPEDRLVVPEEGEPLEFGAFTVTLLASPHSPGDRFPGTVDRPLVPPARPRAWATGTSYTVHVRHRGRPLLVHASANYRAGALAGVRAETVYLGVGGLGRQSARFRAAYWDEVVAATGARRVVPVHWDDFTRPLDRPPVPLPRVADDLAVSMDFLLRRGDADGVDVALPVAWRATDPF